MTWPVCTSKFVSHSTAQVLISGLCFTAGLHFAQLGPFHTIRRVLTLGSRFTRQGRVRYLGLFHTTRMWHHRLSLSLSLCARGLSVCVRVPLVRTRENKLRCAFLAILHASLWYLVGAGAPWIALDLLLCIPFWISEKLGCLPNSWKQHQVFINLLQHRRSKSSTSSSKGFFLCLRPARERKGSSERLQFLLHLFSHFGRLAEGGRSGTKKRKKSSETIPEENGGCNSSGFK